MYVYICGTSLSFFVIYSHPARQLPSVNILERQLVSPLEAIKTPWTPMP